MCPNECPGLDEVWGEEFEKLYERYEKNTKVIKILTMVFLIWGSKYQASLSHQPVSKNLWKYLGENMINKLILSDLSSDSSPKLVFVIFLKTLGLVNRCLDF